MLLRSSSTPVVGSLLSSFPDSTPNNISSHCEHKPPSIHHTPNKFSFHQSGPLSISHNSSPISPSIDFDRYSLKGFRRAQSDGNLEGLAYASCENNDQFCELSQPKKFSGRSKCFMLQTIPSFSLHNRGGEDWDEDEEERDMEYSEVEEEELEEDAEQLQSDGRSVERTMAMKGDYVGLQDQMKNMTLSEEVQFMDKMWSGGFEKERKELTSQEIHLARGLGIDGSGGGRGGGEGNWEGASGGEDGGDNNHGVEEHYKKMIQENPGNPLFLRNYAKFLYQSKKDLHGSEEYYSRAILADPNDGDIIAQYASIIWELHHDQDRASSYYERAAQAAPQDSHVHAAYARLLWETEEDQDEDEDEASTTKDLDTMQPYRHQGIMTSASA